MLNGDCVAYSKTVSVGSMTVCNRSTSVMVLVEELAVMLAALLIARVDPLTGVKATFDDATCVYPLKSSTGSGAEAAEVEVFREVLEVTLAGAAPAPPVSQ